MHIELRKVAKLLVVAPLSANTMAKFANGMCDNLLTCVFRAWDFQKKALEKDFRGPQAAGSVIVAPAMNTFMYEHPLTEVQERTLRDILQVNVLETVEKRLMCGDLGRGAMASLATIMNAIQTQR